MIEYDKDYRQSEIELLLLNIARLERNEPPHFTMLASISNSVSFSASLSSLFAWSAGVKPPKGNAYQTGFGAATSEAPLFSMLPIQGQDFANRLYSPLTSHFTYFMLRDQDPMTLLLLVGAYIWVVEGQSPSAGTDCYQDEKKPYDWYRYEVFTSPCTYWNDPSDPYQQDKFWSFADRIEYRKQFEDKLWLEKLSGDLDADASVVEVPSSPSVTELEMAAKDSLRWVPERYELVESVDHNHVLQRASEAPTDDEIAKAKSRGETWIIAAPSKPVYELIDSRHGRKARVLATSETAPSTKDILDAAKSGFQWVKKGATELKYQLIRPATQYTDKIFAILDFNPDDSQPPLSFTKIWQYIRSDPQNYVYVEFRKEPRFKAFIKIRDFVEVLSFLADSSRNPPEPLFPPDKIHQERLSRQFVGQAKELPENLHIEASIPYEGSYFFVPSFAQISPSDQGAFKDQKKRDQEAFRWLYTLYQMSQVDVSKLPLVPVTISK